MTIDNLEPLLLLAVLVVCCYICLTVEYYSRLFKKLSMMSLDDWEVQLQPLFCEHQRNSLLIIKVRVSESFLLQGQQCQWHCL